MQDQRQTVRPWFVAMVLIVASIGLLALREIQFSRKFQSAQQERLQLLDQQEALKVRVQQAEASVADSQNRSATPSLEAPTVASSQKAQPRISILEAQVRDLQSALRRPQSRPSVPEYDPTNPQSALTQSEPPEPQTNSVPMRNWGTEQALGAPNTERAGDLPTAWASREPDAGPEWLAVGFDQAMDVAEVRVRETFNPGAISKITALVNGGEVVLWEGTASGGMAPRDFVIPVSGNIRADSVVIHLDSARVPGWNEIDAVELVGRDGSRQWATSSSASSSYADSRGLDGQPVPAAGR